MDEIKVEPKNTGEPIYCLHYHICKDAHSTCAEHVMPITAVGLTDLPLAWRTIFISKHECATCGYCKELRDLCVKDFEDGHFSKDAFCFPKVYKGAPMTKNQGEETKPIESPSPWSVGTLVQLVDGDKAFGEVARRSEWAEGLTGPLTLGDNQVPIRIRSEYYDNGRLVAFLPSEIKPYIARKELK